MTTLPTFEELHRKLHGRLIAYFLRHGAGTVDRARDLTQEVFLEVFRSWGQFRGEASWESWVFGIARNTAFDARARQARRRGEVAWDPLEENEFGDPSFEHELTSRMSWQDAQKMLAKLKEEDREVLQLKVNEYSTRQMAILLRLPIETVRSRLRSARARLRELMGDCK